MSTPVVPTKLKLLRGNPGQRPIRHEPEPRIPIEFPQPPEHLSDDAKSEWQRLGPELYHLGLLTVSDLNSFTCYCNSCGRWMTAERELTQAGVLTQTAENGQVIAHPLVAVARNAAADMMRYSTEFGLTPAARRKLAASAVASASKFNGLTT